MSAGDKETLASDMTKELERLETLRLRAHKLGFTHARDYIADAYDFLEEALKQIPE